MFGFLLVYLEQKVVFQLVGWSQSKLLLMVRNSAVVILRSTLKDKCVAASHGSASMKIRGRQS